MQFTDLAAGLRGELARADGRLSMDPREFNTMCAMVPRVERAYSELDKIAFREQTPPSLDEHLRTGRNKLQRILEELCTTFEGIQSMYLVQRWLRRRQIVNRLKQLNVEVDDVNITPIHNRMSDPLSTASRDVKDDQRTSHSQSDQLRGRDSVAEFAPSIANSVGTSEIPAAVDVVMDPPSERKTASLSSLGNRAAVLSECVEQMNEAKLLCETALLRLEHDWKQSLAELPGTPEV